MTRSVGERELHSERKNSLLPIQVKVSFSEPASYTTSYEENPGEVTGGMQKKFERAKKLQKSGEGV